MDSIRHNSITAIVIFEDGNNYTIDNVVKIERFFNKDSKLALRITYESNADGYVDNVFFSMMILTVFY